MNAAISPCVGICRLDDETGYCIGCGRTGDEIATWSTAGPGGRRAIWAALPARLRCPGRRRPPAAVGAGRRPRLRAEELARGPRRVAAGRARGLGGVPLPGAARVRDPQPRRHRRGDRRRGRPAASVRRRGRGPSPSMRGRRAASGSSWRWRPADPDRPPGRSGPEPRSGRRCHSRRGADAGLAHRRCRRPGRVLGHPRAAGAAGRSRRSSGARSGRRGWRGRRRHRHRARPHRGAARPRRAGRGGRACAGPARRLRRRRLFPAGACTACDGRHSRRSDIVLNSWSKSGVCFATRAWRKERRSEGGAGAKGDCRDGYSACACQLPAAG